MGSKAVFYCLFATFMVFFIIGLPTFLMGCNESLPNTCINYDAVNAVVFDYRVVKRQCKGCKKCSYYDCYYSYAEFHYKDTNSSSCLLETASGVRHESAAKNAAHKYHLGQTYRLLHSKSQKSLCMKGKDLMDIWISGLTFLILSGLVFLCCIPVCSGAFTEWYTGRSARIQAEQTAVRHKNIEQDALDTVARANQIMEKYRQNENLNTGGDSSTGIVSHAMVAPDIESGNGNATQIVKNVENNVKNHQMARVWKDHKEYQAVPSGTVATLSANNAAVIPQNLSASAKPKKSSLSFYDSLFAVPNEKLYYAVKDGNATKVRSILLNHSEADKDFQSQKYENDGNSLLHTAVQNHDIEVARVLVKAGASFTLLNDRGLLAFHLIRNQPVEFICLFQSAILCVDVDAQSRDGWTLLHFAADRGDYDVVHALLAVNVDVHVQNSAMKTPVDYAKQTDIRTLIESAVQRSIPTVVPSRSSIRDADGRYKPTCLSVAEIGSKYDTIELYLSSESGNIERVSELLVNPRVKVNARIEKENRQTALYIACKKGHAVIVRALISAGADVDMKDNYSTSPLCVAAVSKQVEIVQLLLAAGADVHFNDYLHKWTALHYAAFVGSSEIIHLLLSAGANKNETDKEGRTALYIASECGHLAVVSVLVDFNASVNVKTNAGHTSMDVAQNNGHSDIVTFLMQYEDQ